MPIELDTLTEERDRLKTTLRTLETEQRRLEGELKRVRQSELRAKREIDALSTLIELGQARKDAEKDAEKKDGQEPETDDAVSAATPPTDGSGAHADSGRPS